MITQVRAQFNGTWYTLTYNEATGYYETELPGVESSAGQPGKWYNVTVEATNDRGNTATRDGSTLSTLQRVVKEGTPPVLTLISPAEGILDTGTPTVIFDAVDPGETASGIDPDTVKLELDGVQVPLTLSEIEAGYRATFTPDEAISDGPHSFTATVYDNDGNGAVLSFAYVIDTTPPEVSVYWDYLKRVTDDLSVTVTGRIYDATTGISGGVIVNGEHTVTLEPGENGEFTATVPLDIGINDLTLTATDNAGWSTSESWRVMRLITDRTAEDAALISTLDGLVKSGGFDSLTGDQQDILNHWHRGAYNAEDANRVEYAVELLQALVNAYVGGLMDYGLTIGVAFDPRWWPLHYHGPGEPYKYGLTVKTDWALSDEPSVNWWPRYLGNVDSITGSFEYDKPAIPTEMDAFTWPEANAIEDALVGLDGAKNAERLAVKAEMDRIPPALVYAGECWAGDGMT